MIIQKSHRYIFCGLAIFAAVVSHSAIAADPIGKIKTLNGGATITREGHPSPATVGTNVFQADTVTTAADGKVGMTFIDNSMMSLGPNSTLSLDKFRFDSTTYEGEFGSSLKRGTLAAVSGRIAKQTPEAMRIQTPSAILGVRGTEFFVKVGDGGQTDAH